MSKLVITKCKDEKMSPNDLLLLYAATYSIKGIPLTSDEKQISIKNLKEKECIDDNNKLTSKGKRIILEYSDALSVLEGKGRKVSKQVDIAILEAKVAEFIDDYRILFKVKTGGMGDAKGCKNKMIQFFKDYPEYADKDLILSATKKYINSLNNYTYMKRADYFISKEDTSKSRTSMLASYCEELELEGGNYEEVRRDEMI